MFWMDRVCFLPPQGWHVLENNIQMDIPDYLFSEGSCSCRVGTAGAGEELNEVFGARCYKTENWKEGEGVLCIHLLCSAKSGLEVVKDPGWWVVCNCLDVFLCKTHSYRKQVYCN